MLSPDRNVTSMHDASHDIQPVNSFDVAFRREVMAQAFAAQDQELLSSYRAACRVVLRAVKTVTAAAVRAGQAMVTFWNIPPLGPSDGSGIRRHS